MRQSLFFNKKKLMKKVTKKSTTHSPSSNGNENIETNINSNDWSSQSSAHLYQVEQWGEGYFQVDQKGQLCISPQKDPNGPLIPLVAVVEEARHASLEFPIVFRFHDILRQQVSNLNNTFIRIIGEAQYQGKYTGVYPIKVNQMREVVEEVLDVGDQFNYGLEAGSKAELLAVLALNKNPQSLTVLNGYKDTEYLKLAILGKKLERNVVVVIEKFSELVELNKLAKEEESIPLIGLRAKLGTRSTGKWSDSSGDFAKFGLTLPEMMKSIKFLKENNILSETKLFHFHVGSQIPDIRTIKECITEGARMYAQLYKMGVPLCYFDVGGGVGINYDGSKSPTQSSVNYSLQDYIGDIVYILKEICDLEGVPHPNIVSESGRLITAHHSCIITNVFGSINLFEQHLTNEELTHSKKHHLVKNMHLLLKDLSITNYLDTYNDAVVFKEESSNAFKLGVINLEDRATIEHLYWRICHQIIDIIRNLTQVPNELAQLESLMCDKYLCNFSDVFCFRHSAI